MLLVTGDILSSVVTQCLNTQGSSVKKLVDCPVARGNHKYEWKVLCSLMTIHVQTSVVIGINTCITWVPCGKTVSGSPSF